MGELGVLGTLQSAVTDKGEVAHKIETRIAGASTVANEDEISNKRVEAASAIEIKGEISGEIQVEGEISSEIQVKGTDEGKITSAVTGEIRITDEVTGEITREVASEVMNEAEVTDESEVANLVRVASISAGAVEVAGAVKVTGFIEGEITDAGAAKIKIPDEVEGAVDGDCACVKESQVRVRLALTLTLTVKGESKVKGNRDCCCEIESDNQIKSQ